jgi:hypothetical protein
MEAFLLCVVAKANPALAPAEVRRLRTILHVGCLLALLQRVSPPLPASQVSHREEERAPARWCCTLQAFRFRESFGRPESALKAGAASIDWAQRRLWEDRLLRSIGGLPQHRIMGNKAIDQIAIDCCPDFFAHNERVVIACAFCNLRNRAGRNL